MQIYELIIRLIPAWLQMLLGALAALGWVWRLRLRTKCAPPWGARAASAIGWFLMSAFYAMQQFVPDVPIVISVAMVRIVWLFLATNEIVQHIYIFRINRYVEKSKWN